MLLIAPDIAIFLEPLITFLYKIEGDDSVMKIYNFNQWGTIVFIAFLSVCKHSYHFALNSIWNARTYWIWNTCAYRIFWH